MLQNGLFVPSPLDPPVANRRHRKKDQANCLAPALDS